MENKDKIEIPFGAKDSELCECEYTIPEGYKAEIKDGKVIIRKKESEDENIRNTIFDCLYKCCDSGIITREQRCICIAWLEKQGEHANFRNKIQIGDKVTRNKDGVLVNLSQLNRVAKKDEKQGEQKPLMYSEEDKKLIRNLRSELSNLRVRKLIKEETYIKYVNLLNGILHQSCWKPSEEQMQALEYFIINHNEHTGYAKDLEELRQDLKKLKA